MSFRGILLGLFLIWFGRRKKISYLSKIGSVIIVINSFFILFFILGGILNILQLRGMVLLFATPVLFLYLFKNKYFSNNEIEEWKSRDYTNTKPEEFFNAVRELTKRFGKEHLLDIPVGRAIYFSQSSEGFVPTDAEADFLVYDGKPSENEKEFSFKEYGYLITSESIYYCNQWKQNLKWHESKLYIPFSGAYKVVGKKVFYANKKSIDLSIIDEESFVYLIDIMYEAINSGYTRNLYFSSFSDDFVWEELIQSNDDNLFDQGINDKFDTKIEELKLKNKYSTIGGVATASLNSQMAHEAQLNQMLSGSQGHGVAAEWGNTVVDRAFGKNVKTQVGGMNAKFGADRSINGTKAQTKYYQTVNNGNVVPGDARASINSYIGNIDGYFSNDVRQVEIPRDQYADGVKRMAQAIRDGKIPGENNPMNAKKYVRKGFWEYDQAHAIAKSGTIPSLTVDLLGGVQCALPGASISAVITYWNARSNGLDPKEARNLTAGVFSKSIIIGTLTYAGTMQLSKKITEKGGKQAASKILSKMAGETAEATFKKINIGLMLVTQIGPSLTNTIIGRSSGADLGTTVITTGGGMGGAVIGQALIPIPGVGLVVGSVIGSIAGGSLGNYIGKIIFGESSQSKMMKILKQEFIDVVYTSPLNNEEITELMEKIFSNKKMKKELGLMYASSKYRNYARNIIVFQPMEEILRKRQEINEDEYDSLLLTIAS